MRRRQVLRALLLAPAASLARAGRGRADDQAAVPAAETQALLDRIRRVHVEAKTYRDTGESSFVFFEPDGTRRREVKTTFTTAFARPDRFRFSCTSTSPTAPTQRYFIARDATRTVRSWWDGLTGFETSPTLSLALVKAGSVSNRTSTIVPYLLLADERQAGNWTFDRHIERLADARTAARPCHRLKTVIPPYPDAPEFAGTTQVYWVDAESLLLRRVELKSTFATFYAEAITTYEPEANGAISDAALAFDPPAAPPPARPDDPPAR